MMRRKTISTHLWAKVKKAMLLELKSRSQSSGQTSKIYKISYNLRKKSLTKWIVDHMYSLDLKRVLRRNRKAQQEELFKI